MVEDLERAYYMLAGLFAAMPPAVFLAASLILLAGALWFSQHALQSFRIVHAVANAPLTDLRSDAPGLVKLRGTAHPRNSASGIVWYSHTSRSGSNSSTRVSTDNFLIRDGHGACAVETAKAEIVPTSKVSDHALFDKSRTTDESVIRAGDAVFALGELKRGLPPLAGVEEAPCQLRRSGGVLFVSGSSEREVKVLYVLWSIVHAPLAMLCWALFVLGSWTHISSYPPGGGGSIITFVDALRTMPLQSDPGAEYQLREEADKGRNSTTPRSD